MAPQAAHARRQFPNARPPSRVVAPLEKPPVVATHLTQVSAPLRPGFSRRSIRREFSAGDVALLRALPRGADSVLRVRRARKHAGRKTHAAARAARRLRVSQPSN